MRLGVSFCETALCCCGLALNFTFSSPRPSVSL